MNFICTSQQTDVDAEIELVKGRKSMSNQNGFMFVKGKSQNDKPSLVQAFSDLGHVDV